MARLAMVLAGAARVAVPVVVLAVGACQGGSSNAGGSPPPASAAGTAPGALVAAGVNVAAVESIPDQAPVVLKGLYLGWQGPCKGVPPTRSAWQLADAAQAGAPCVYVDGPLLRGAPPAAASAGIPVRVEGVVHAEGTNRYIEARKVERL